MAVCPAAWHTECAELVVVVVVVVVVVLVLNAGLLTSMFRRLNGEKNL